MSDGNGMDAGLGGNFVSAALELWNRVKPLFPRLCDGRTRHMAGILSIINAAFLPVSFPIFFFFAVNMPCM